MLPVNFFQLSAILMSMVRMSGFFEISVVVGRLPQMDGGGAVGHRVADKAGRGRIDHREFSGVGTELAREPVEHYVVGRTLGGRNILALEILQRLRRRAAR